MSNSSDGGYYNIASVNSCIRVDDLQRIIAEKNRKENNIFAEEYKVASYIQQNIYILRNIVRNDFFIVM